MSIHYAPAGPPVIAALRDAIRLAKADSPLAPVTVVVPSNYAGLSLRRVLAGQGLVNVRFMVLARVAELLGGPLFAAEGQLPLTPALRAEVIRAALAEEPGIFAPVAGHAATEAALDATFRDLRDASGDALDRVAAVSPRAESVVALYRGFRDRCRGRFYDEGDLAVAAMAAVEGGSAARRDLGQVIVYLPARLSLEEGRLVGALQSAWGARVLLATTGDPDGDEPLARMAAALGQRQLPFQDGKPPRAERLIVAPDLEEEARSAIRLVLERAEGGLPFHRMAILYRNSDPVARVLHEQLAAAGIPASGPAVEALADTVAGRALLALLHLPDHDFRRDLVFDWLTSAPVLDSEGKPVPAARWDTIARAAGIASGRREWDHRLSGHIAQLRADIDVREAEGRLSIAARMQDDVAHATALRGFIDELCSALADGPGSTWEDAAARAIALLHRYLGDTVRWQAIAAERGTPEAAAALEAHEAIAERLEKLALLDRAGFRPTAETFLRTVEAALRVPAGRAGGVGHGVFVGSLAAAGGMDFNLVIVVGAAEGLLPARVREDPLLPDAERAAGGEAIPLRAGRRGDERRAFLLALACAPERVLSYARASQRDQRKQLPSRWFLESASALAGRPVLTREVDDLPATAWLTPVASFANALEIAGTPLSPAEYELQALARLGPLARTHPFAMAEPMLARGLEAAAARLDGRLGEWEGCVDPDETLAPSVDRPTSPTALQAWAECPFRYFLASVLGVAEFEDPSAGVELSPLDRGTIVHRILERFFQEAALDAPDAEWTAAQRRRMEVIATEEFNRAESAGITGAPLLSRLARQRILRDVMGLLDKEHEVRAASGLVFARAELPFGRVIGGDGPVRFDLGDGRAIAFRGQVDRIDRSEAGQYGVLDYKTGAPRAYEGLSEHDPVHRGKHLQLPVYALAVKQTLGWDGPVRADYWFVDEQHEFKRIGYEVTETAVQHTQETLRRMVDGIAAGCFPAVPGGPGRPPRPQNCMFCAYDRVCPSGRVRLAEKRLQDPLAAPFHALGASDADD